MLGRRINHVHGSSICNSKSLVWVVHSMWYMSIVKSRSRRFAISVLQGVKGGWTICTECYEISERVSKDYKQAIKEPCYACITRGQSGSNKTNDDGTVHSTIDDMTQEKLFLQDTSTLCSPRGLLFSSGADVHNDVLKDTAFSATMAPSTNVTTSKPPMLMSRQRALWSSA